MPLEATDGGRKPRATDDEILAVFRETPDPVLSTAEVAESLPIQRRGTLNRLRRLQEDGRLDSKQIGGRNTVWWLTDRTASTAPAPETVGEPDGREESGTGAESAASETGVPTTPDTGEADTDSATPRDDELVADVRAYLADRPPRKAHAKEAVLDVFRLLRERGTMKTGELKDALYETYADHYGSKRAMWESVSRYLDDVPGIEKGGYGEWTYAGDETTTPDEFESRTG